MSATPIGKLKGSAFTKPALKGVGSSRTRGQPTSGAAKDSARSRAWPSTSSVPQRYFTLCFFIITLNISEIFLNDVAYPLINFSTYNPYKVEIYDFTQSELEFYSNIIYFIQNSKRLLQIATAVSQIDLACLTLLSSQGSIFFVIRYLLNKKQFLIDEESNNESIHKYVSVPYGSTQPSTELTRINI